MNELMEYNTKRNQLIIPEYGRNIQKMVEYALSIKDRKERTEFANSIIDSMANVNAEAKNMSDYKHKLWDHLFIISDYRLDVDSPYPMPDRKHRETRPEMIGYSHNQIAFRPYGRLIEEIIEEIAKMEDGEERNEQMELAAHQLKRAYLQWNRDSVDDELILKHFEELSKGELKLDDDFRLNTTRSILHNNRRRNQPNRNQPRANSRRQRVNNQRNK